MRGLDDLVLSQEMVPPHAPKWLESYVHDLAVDLGLSEWAISIGEKPTSEDAWAAIFPNVPAKEAELRVCSEFSTLPQVQQRALIVHELGHLMTARLVEVAKSVKRELGISASSIFLSLFDVAEESAVESFTRACAEHVALPPKNKRKN